MIGVRALVALLAGATAACSHPPLPVPEPLPVRVGGFDASALVATAESPPRGFPERIARLAELFERAGCRGEALAVTWGGPRRSARCTLAGRTPDAILVAVNADRAPVPPEPPNWTGAALLPELRRALAVEPREHTFVFAGFGPITRPPLARYRWRTDARDWLRRLGDLPSDRIRAVVNLKELGLGFGTTLASSVDPDLRRDLRAVRDGLGLPPEYLRFFRSLEVDGSSLRVWGIPTITIYSSPRLLPAEARRDAAPLDAASYRETARLLAFYLAYLDDTLRLRQQRRASR